jgi:hypothetical protein
MTLKRRVSKLEEAAAWARASEPWTFVFRDEHSVTRDSDAYKTILHVHCMRVLLTKPDGTKHNILFNDRAL